jgi:hypothetical protein
MADSAFTGGLRPVISGRDLDLLRRAVGHLRAPEAPTALCLDDETVAALAAGSTDPTLRASALPHLAECPRCRSAVASVARALSDRSVSREVRKAEPLLRGSRYHVALPIAAAAVLMLLVWSPRSLDEVQPGHRSPTISAAASPAPLSPVGTVADVPILRWSSVAGSDRYRVTLFESGGGVLFEQQLSDTAVALPDSVVLMPGRPYLWKVDARIGWDRWTTSEVVEFRVAGGPPR